MTTTLNAEMTARRERWLAEGKAVEVRVEGWRSVQLAPGSDVSILAELEAGRIPDEWAPIESSTAEEVTFLSPLDPVSARGRAKPLFGFDYTWDVYKPVEQRRFGYYTMPILWGDRLVGRFGRLRSVLAVDDHTVLLTTSNRDGRTTAREGDDRLVLVTVT